LCGKPLSGETNRDHVPPRQFFPEEVRKTLDPQLDTVPVHASCNSAHRADEEYFAYSLGALAGESAAGGALWRDQSRRFKEGELKGLAMKVLGEFERRDADPELPEGKVFKRVDRQRASRVMWKIVRGLYFLDRKEILPDEIDATIEIVEPERKCPTEYDYVLAQQSQGRYRGVFDYKSVVLGNKLKLEMWAMLFWDRVMVFVTFHALTCACDDCAAAKRLQD